MTPRRTCARRIGTFLAVAALAGGLLLPSAAGATTQPLNDQSVTVRVLDVSPSTPTPSDNPQKLTITIGLDNTTDQTLANLQIHADRGDPIDSQVALDAAMARPKAPSPNLVAPVNPDTPVTTSLAARASTSVTYTTTTGVANGSVGMCLCHDAIYPIYLTVHYQDVNLGDTIVGTAQTYVPAFGLATPQPEQVTWVWPIIDRPHRLTSDTVFTDDDLTTSVTTGRLDRVLRVVEQVAGQVPMTLVLDPDLIDELQVMSTGTYEVTGPDGKIQAGTGGAAAAAWLLRLRTVLTAHPDLQVEFTPFADPDIESLTRTGLKWTVGMSTAAANRVSAALGGRVPTSRLSWPAGETLSGDTLDAVHSYGASTVILSDRSLSAGASPRREALAPLQTSTGPITVAVTSTSVENLVDDVLSVGGSGAAALPKLVAQVALLPAALPEQSHYVLVTAPRYIDPAPDVAVRAIRETAHTFWSKPITLGSAEQSVQAVNHGTLVPRATGSALPTTLITTAMRINSTLPALTSMLEPADANRVLSGFPAGVQRAESSAWRDAPALGAQYADQLGRSVDAVESGVSIVKPSSGTYTLASENSPLPIAITNRLDYAVHVRVQVTAVNGLPGVSARDIGQRVVAPHSTVTLHIPITVQRTGRFQVQAQLFTPNDMRLGSPVYLSIHSTALGTIGVVITVVAAAVLVLALLVRIFRRLRGRGRPTPAEAPASAVVS